MSSPEQQELESEYIEINDHIDMGEALRRLEKNPDFQKVIIDGYLTRKVKASVSLLATPGIKQRGERPDVFEDIISASNLQFFLHMTETFYESALDQQLNPDSELGDEDDDEPGVH